MVLGHEAATGNNPGMAERRDDDWGGLLEPALTAAHRALGRLDDEDVPVPLRPIRAMSKNRTLPKPHRRVLAAHLEEEWLRNLATAELNAGESSSDQASRLFLTRPDGWEAQIDEMAEHAAERRVAHEIDTLAAEKARLEGLNEELGRRVRDAEDRVRELERRLESDDRVEALRRRLDDATRTISRLEAVIEERDAEVQRIRGELDEADERIGVLRGRAAKEADAPDQSDASPRAFGRGRPIETARLLDELAEALRPRRGEAETRVEVIPLQLPPGLSPDSADAIDWIRSVNRKVLVLVDGHNVAHDLMAEPGRTARDRVVSEVARLRRLSDGPMSAVVFFDTGTETETHHNFGVTVRYVPDADAAIESAVAAADIDCIVISTDREVRSRSAAHGALTLWGTAFSAWIRRR